jgi:hypothetical protein
MLLEIAITALRALNNVAKSFEMEKIGIAADELKLPMG